MRDLDRPMLWCAHPLRSGDRPCGMEGREVLGLVLCHIHEKRLREQIRLEEQDRADAAELARYQASRLDQLAVITRVPGRSTSAEGRIASRVSFDTAGRSDPGAIETPGPLDPGVLEDADPGSETTRTPGLQRPASEVLSEVLSEEQNARTVEPSTTSHSTVDEQSFDVFWTSYPKRNGQRLGRAKALTAWAKLNTTERSAAIAAIDAYTAASKGWPKDCERYLRDRLFADVDLDATNSGTTVGADRSDRIAAFLATPEPPALPEARVG